MPYVIFTSPLPEVPLSPVQSLDPLAEHEEAFDDEKVKVTDVPVAADEDDALKSTGDDSIHYNIPESVTLLKYHMCQHQKTI